MPEVFLFCGVFPEVEFQESVFFFDFVDDDIGCVVFEGSGPDFYLLDVAQTVVFRAHSYGEYGVKEVV